MSLLIERVKSTTYGKVSSQSCTICLLKKEPNRSSTCGGGVSLFYELNYNEVCCRNKFLLEAKSNRQAEIKMQAGMSSMLIIAWRMSCSQILRELHFVICVVHLMIALLQLFFHVDNAGSSLRSMC